MVGENVLQSIFFASPIKGNFNLLPNLGPVTFPSSLVQQLTAWQNSAAATGKIIRRFHHLDRVKGVAGWPKGRR